MTSSNGNVSSNSFNTRSNEIVSHSWETTRDTLAIASQDRHQDKILLGIQLAQYILKLPDTSKPSWWNEHREEFWKLSDAVDVNNIKEINEVTDKILAIKNSQEEEASSLDLITSKKLPTFIKQLADEKNWKALRILLHRIAADMHHNHRLLFWWTEKISLYIEGSVILENLSIDEIYLYQTLHWEYALTTLAKITRIDALQTSVIERVDIKFLRKICDYTPLHTIPTTDIFFTLYKRDRTAASILVNRYIDASGKDEAPGWWNLCVHPLINRYTVFTMAINFNDKETALRFSLLPIDATDKESAFLASSIASAAKKKWAVVCNNLFARGASLFARTTDSLKRSAWENILCYFGYSLEGVISKAAFQENLTKLIQKKDYSQLLDFLDLCYSRMPVCTWLQEDSIIQKILLKVTQENKMLFQSLLFDSKPAFQIFCELKIKPVALQLATLKTLFTQLKFGIFGFEHIEAHFGAEILETALARFSLNTEEIGLYIISLFKHDRKKLGKELLISILKKPAEHRPSWFTNPKFATPLFMALMEQKEYEFACHMTSYININYKDDLERTPFFFVVLSQNKTLIRLFLDKGADITEISKVPNAKKAWEYIEEMDRSDVNALLSTMALTDYYSTMPRLRYFFTSDNTNGKKIIIQRLETEKPEWLDEPQNATDLFCLAVFDNELAFAEQLVPAVDVNSATSLFEPACTPLHFCLHKGSKLLARLLVQEGASLSKNGELLKTTYLQALIDANYISLDELPSLMSPNSSSIFRNIQLVQQEAPAVAQALFNKVISWIDIPQGKLPIIKDFAELDALYEIAGDSFATQIFEAQPLSKSLFSLMTLLNGFRPFNAIALIRRCISTLGTERQPTWWNISYTRSLFTHIFWLSQKIQNQEELLKLAKALLPHFDASKMSNQEKKDLLAIVMIDENLAWGFILIEAGLATNKSLVDQLARTYGEKNTIQILEKLPLKKLEVHALLLCMIRDKNQEILLLSLFNRLMKVVVTNQRPSWFTSSRATNLFFALMEQKSPNLLKAAKGLLPYIDCTKTNPRNKERSVLMIALENKFTVEDVTQLLQGSSLFHIDEEGISSFSLALKNPQIIPVNYLQTCLRQCGLPEEHITACTRYETLQKYVDMTLNDTAPSHRTARIILNLLYNKKADVKKLVNTLSPSVRLDLVSQIGKIGGESIQNAFIDCAFSIERTQFKKGTLSVKTPTKEDASMDIQEALLDLYDTYATSKSEAERDTLIVFASRVNNRTPYLGTPRANTEALAEFYTIIDNATCNTIYKLKKELQNASPLTEEQNTLLSNFFHEVIEAAPKCGGRYMSTAVQQYSRIVLGIKEDLQSTFFTHAALRREYLAAEIVNRAKMHDERTGALVPEDNTTHLYIYLVGKYGKELGLPGALMASSFEDVCLWPRHREQAAAIAKEFAQRYTPAMITDFIRQELIEEPLKGLFEDQLTKGTYKEWYDIHVPLIMQEIEKRFLTPAPTPPTTAQAEVVYKVMAAKNSQVQTASARNLTTKEVDAIENFLAEAPYYVTLANTPTKREQIKTVDDVATVLRTDPKLYWMLNHEGKSFTKESIIRELLGSNILCP